MLQTLFAPWQRLQESHSHGLDIENYFSTMAVNMVMRCVGIIIRCVFIVVGLVCIALTLAGGVAVFLIWLVLPGAIIFAFVLGFILLFRAS